jgi:hypothetical protein
MDFIRSGLIEMVGDMCQRKANFLVVRIEDGALRLNTIGRWEKKSY